jgi:hypothetical protein
MALGGGLATHKEQNGGGFGLVVPGQTGMVKSPLIFFVFVFQFFKALFIF